MIGLSGLITPSLDEMVHVAREMERQGFHDAAVDRRRHDQRQAHGGQDRAGLSPRDGARARRLAQRGRGRSAQEPEMRPAFEAKNREEQAGAGRVVQSPPAGRARAVRRGQGASASPPIGQTVRIDVPKFTGTRVLDDFPLATLVDYIDWSPFFLTWELKGKYPKILERSRRSAKRPASCSTMPRRCWTRSSPSKLLTARGVYGFWPAASVGDDIVLFADESRTSELTRFHTLRQQWQRQGPDAAFWRWPTSSPRSTAGGRTTWARSPSRPAMGVDELVAKFEADHDDYNAIMVKALADRLAEAFAECLHRTARGDWGYGAEEQLSNDELIAEKYRGIRPAPGYPACPDHTEKRTLFELLDAAAASRHPPDRELCHDPGLERQRLVLRPSRQPLLLRRPHRPRPGRRLRPPQGHERGRNRALAGAEPGLRSAGVAPDRLRGELSPRAPTGIQIALGRMVHCACVLASQPERSHENFCRGCARDSGLGGVAVATPATTCDAARGHAFRGARLRAADQKAYLPPDFDQETFDELWKGWEEPLRSQAEKATPDERRAMAFSRYGLTSAPGDTSGKPQQYVVDAAGQLDDDLPGLPPRQGGRQGRRRACPTRCSRCRRWSKTCARPSCGCTSSWCGWTWPRPCFRWARPTAPPTRSCSAWRLMANRDAELNVAAATCRPRWCITTTTRRPGGTSRRNSGSTATALSAKDHRPLMQFMLVPENGPEKFHEWEADFREIYAWLESLEPPAYPFEIDRTLAGQGEVVFNDHCAECHGTLRRTSQLSEQDRVDRRSGTPIRCG